MPKLSWTHGDEGGDFVAAARDDFGEEIVAKVFEDGEAVRDILIEDIRRRQADVSVGADRDINPRLVQPGG